MNLVGEIIIAIAILIGIAGIILPVLPGVLVVFGAILIWAIFEGTSTGWIVFVIATGFLVVTAILQYTWPGRSLREAGIPMRSIVIGLIAAVIGFFVIPVIGLFIGFIGGTFLAEAARVRRPEAAWAATVQATKAVVVSTLIQLLGALAAAATWVIGAWIL
ncbi:DUF456 domain-containing protein [Hoyosella rhizosphaerae]|uniref:DUF456 domain-containing protein n=1 Tax=Hoyosella rhizosphaerae TaxID=1755582 RepID=A0A916U6S1_9ACTN|nr:DUF456 domain-containing protein [Hoyosella rhizosphaerae]MBN4927744.1 DUF456 domain-containing protein [Hoyosella rhizosphaerae]GGC61910.1 hypothetical protein GCM10011410_12990 [Hoyosella rhizosphaerae]